MQSVTVLFSFVIPLMPQVVYPVGKAILILAPLAWVWRKGWGIQEAAGKWGIRLVSGDFSWGIGTGLGISLIVAVSYFALWVY